MAENEKDIFPRRPEDEAEKARLQALREQARRNLENEEQSFKSSQIGQEFICQTCQTKNSPDAKFCLVCGSPQNLPFDLNRVQPDYEIHTTVYGPPPMLDENTHPAPVYGPPPMIGIVTKIFTPIFGVVLGLILLIGVLLIAGLILYFELR